MAIFTSPVDRYFVGKMFFGLAFVFSFCATVLACLALAGAYRTTSGLIADSPRQVAILSGVSAGLSLILFRVIERARRRPANRGASGR